MGEFVYCVDNIPCEIYNDTDIFLFRTKGVG